MASAIEFDHVSKQYRLGLVSTKTLSHDIRRFWITNILHHEDPYLKIGETNDRSTKGSSEYVWALKDINFKVDQGDVVGIIGKNGAGKSTLLKLLSRVTGPTTGTIRAHGRIGSLLEVGTGFHGEMTGRENIFMNGAILGMSRREIQSKLDEIIDFSGCERYIDTPVKRYSSGMTVRLGFAVAAFLEPEILVVDEVLAVGDAEFQKKAIGKMKDVSQKDGRTVLFVSHNMASIQRLCNTGIWLDKGMIRQTGPVTTVVEQYLSESYDQEIGCIYKRPIVDATKDFQLLSAEIKGIDDKPRSAFSCDEDIFLDMKYLVRKNVPGIWGYMHVQKAADGTIVWVSDTNDIKLHKMEHMPIGESKMQICFPRRTLAPGTYLICLNYTSLLTDEFNVEAPGDVVKFEIHDTSTQRGDNRNGYFSTLLDWKFI